MHGPPVPVIDVARGLGVRVEALSSYPGWRGALSFDGKTAHIWYYRSDSEPHWAQVYVALELGFLHVGTPGAYRDFDLKITNTVKRGAWIFAQQLLMPLSWIRYYAPIMSHDVKRLAELFAVPDDVMSSWLLYLMNTERL